MIAAQLSGYDLDTGIYVDVGANHPSTISNTYLFYRMGLHGISIEPNPELIALHKKYRPRDIAVASGCGRDARLGILEVSKAPVLSRFAAGDSAQLFDIEIQRLVYVPILPLDDIASAIPHEWIYLMSIDVEGLDIEVLQGARTALTKTLLVCIEAYDERERSAAAGFLEPMGFVLQQAVDCNLIFRNCSESFDRYKRKP